MPPNITEPAIFIPQRIGLFETFKATTLKAQATLDLDDAIAAGAAWRAFLDDFLPQETRDKLEAIKFPNRKGKI